MVKNAFSCKKKICAQLFEAIVKWTKIHVQIMRFTCCLNMGFNLKIPKMIADEIRMCDRICITKIPNSSSEPGKKNPGLLVTLSLLETGTLTYEPRRKKPCLRGFRQSNTKISLLSYRDLVENWSFAWSKFNYDTFQKATNNGADQTAGWSAPLLFRKFLKTGFLATRPILSAASHNGLHCMEKLI